MPHFGAEPVEQHQHTAPGPNLPLCLSPPVYACLCLGLRLQPSPISLPHRQIYCTCLLAPCHPNTHSPASFTERTRRGEKENMARKNIYRERLLMMGFSMFDLHREHPRLSWEVHVCSTTHSACWLPRTNPSTCFFEGHRLCGGPSKHIFIQFHWKDLRLLREAVFEVISLCHCILYRAVMTWVTQ